MRFKNIVIYSILVLSYMCFFCFINLKGTQGCEQEIIRPKIDNKNVYGHLDDINQGIYLKAARESLLVVSLVEYPVRCDLNSNQNLLVTWASPNNNIVCLRAHGLSSLPTKEEISNLYYRMDAQSTLGASSFNWPIRVLRELGIACSDVGVVGWIKDYQIGNNKINLYLPLRIEQAPIQAPNTERRLEVAILPAQELKEVFYNISKIRDDKKIEYSVVSKAEKLPYSYYPAERVFRLNPNLPDANCIYLLEIGVTFRSGAVNTINLWIYNSR